jgi:hypothetical protein
MSAVAKLTTLLGQLASLYTAVSTLWTLLSEKLGADAVARAELARASQSLSDLCQKIQQSLESGILVSDDNKAQLDVLEALVSGAHSQIQTLASPPTGFVEQLFPQRAAATAALDAQFQRLSKAYQDLMISQVTAASSPKATPTTSVVPMGAAPAEAHSAQVASNLENRKSAILLEALLKEVKLHSH